MTVLWKTFVAAVVAFFIWLIHPTWWPGTLWRWGRVIWVCRVSAISAIGGGLLLSVTPQARDCFSDLGLSAPQWAVFFALTFLWAWMVHIAARRALLADDWVPDAHIGTIPAERRDQLRTEFGWPALLVPRLLGLAIFIFIYIALMRARANLVTVEGVLREAGEAIALIDALQFVTVCLAAAYIVVVWTRRQFRQKLAKISAPTEPFLLDGLVPFPLALRRSPRGQPPGRILASIDIIMAVIAVGISIASIAAFIWPHQAAAFLPRALILALLFGGIVLLLNEIGMWSARLRTPLLLAGVALVALFLFVAERFHDVRYFDAGAPADKAQIGLAEAVKRWKLANGNCEPGSERPCPRPILIAGSGGASRAAFMTATVVGAIIDLGREQGQTYGDVRNRIFAMSTVSGSSLGAVTMRAAMTDALERGQPDEPPCIQTPGQRAWFRNRSAQEQSKARYRTSWRDCFQLLLAGDFLSPVAIGLLYRDNIPLAVNDTPIWANRATLLEQAFERRYAEVVKGVPETCGETPGTGLCRAFGWHPSSVGGQGWIPLLLLNGTSVWTGRRIVVTDILLDDPDQSANRLLPYAYDSRQYRDTGKPVDIRLSTAATMSARFPVISPHGNLRALDGNRIDQIVDGGYFENDGLATIADLASGLKAYKLDPVVIRIVNEPSQTEFAGQSYVSRPALPDSDERSFFDDIGAVFRTLISVRSGHLDGHEAYLRGVLGNDRRLIQVGVHKLDAPTPYNPLCKWDVRNAPDFQHATMRNVSMSWWMSQPVQAYLDAQLCARRNWIALECELQAGRVVNGRLADTCE